MQPIAREQGTAAKGIIRVTDKIKIKLIQFTTLQSLKEAAGNRYAWWLKFDRNDRQAVWQYWVWRPKLSAVGCYRARRFR